MKKKKKLFKDMALKIFLFLNSYVKLRVYHLLMFLLVITGYIGVLIGFTLGGIENMSAPSLHADVQIIP